MKLYAVLKQIDGYKPHVVRMFDNDTDAHTFAQLCQKSETADYIRYGVYVME